MMSYQRHLHFQANVTFTQVQTGLAMTINSIKVKSEINEKFGSVFLNRKYYTLTHSLRVSVMIQKEKSIVIGIHVIVALGDWSVSRSKNNSFKAAALCALLSEGMCDDQGPSTPSLSRSPVI